MQSIFIEQQTTCQGRLDCLGSYKSLSTDCVQSESHLFCIISLTTGYYLSSPMLIEWILLFKLQQMGCLALHGQQEIPATMIVMYFLIRSTLCSCVFIVVSRSHLVKKVNTIVNFQVACVPDTSRMVHAACTLRSFCAIPASIFNHTVSFEVSPWGVGAEGSIHVSISSVN